MKKYLFVLVLLLSVNMLFAQDEVKEKPAKADAQPRRLFRGMLIVGLNATQVDGDRQSGFNKAGANVGAGLLVNLPKNFSVALELVYSMKGAKGSADDYKVNFWTRNITLDYIDLPLMVNYTLKNKKGGNWAAMLSAGLVPNVLVRENDEYVISPINGAGPSSSLGYRRFTLDGILGLTGIFKDHYALNFRWQYSVARANNISYSPSNSYFNPYDGQLRHDIISIRAIYIF